MSKSKRGAPLGSRNKALKAGEEGATEFLHLRCRPSDKIKWQAAAGGEALSKWVTETLNSAAADE